MHPLIQSLQGKLIVSCQALPDEPLHSSFVMGRMALAATQGGASGIRANGKADIDEIRHNTSLPIIGIVKKDYADSEIYITPSMQEIDELMRCHTPPEIIALDATDSLRPNGLTLADFIYQIKTAYPQQLLMADCATFEDMQRAQDLGFDLIGTTLVGYTEKSRHLRIEADDFALIKQAVAKLSCPIIAEGNINTPNKVKRVLAIGSHSVVVGSAITRPKWITEQFVQATQEKTS